MVAVELYAHASGFSWDEALLVMAPLAAVAGLLWLANRRATRLDGSEGDGSPVDASEHREPGPPPA